MHPILSRIGRLGLYLLAWVPLAAMLMYLLASSGGLRWLEAAALIAPLCLVYAFICLSAWYSCRSTPLGRSTLTRLLATHLIAAGIISIVWILAANVLASVLSRIASGLPRLESFRDLDQRLAPHIPVLFTAGLLLYLLSVAFHYVLLAIEESRQAEARAMEARVLARDAELKALKAQVNPHFLFNSLNSISALTSVDPTKARDMCVLLADFLRMTLGLGQKASIPLADELSLLRRYLAIEKVRFGARLQMKEDIAEESKPCLVPPLLLQPLIENAVTHGIAHLPEGGTIRLVAQSTNGRLSIVVENSHDAEAPPRQARGMGLENVRRRLEARYGSDAGLSVSKEGARFRVTLLLPAERGEQPA
jgi:sensor histidine kinase YesM